MTHPFNPAHDWVRDNFRHCANCGAPAEHLHHILGSGAKEHGEWIGQWVVTMLCAPCNLPGGPYLPSKLDQVREFIRGPLKAYWHRFGETPMDVDQVMAIVTWSR